MSRRIVIRADAGAHEGVGHVMRVMSLAQELDRRKYDVTMMTSRSGIPWLEDQIQASGIRREVSESGVLDIDAITRLNPDVCLIDSYRFDAKLASELGERVPLVMICDGDTRGVNAALYVDHNLAAETNSWPPADTERILAGAAYAITRDEVMEARATRASHDGSPHDLLRIRCVAGGADFNHTSVTFAQLLIRVGVDADVLFITEFDQEKEIMSLDWGGRRRPTFRRPSSEMLRLLTDADFVLSAAGTTAWDLMTMGIPACLTAVVSNQEPSLSAIDETGIAMSLGTLEAMRTDPTHAVEAVSRMAGDRDLRIRLSARATVIFDGRGRSRIADRIDQLVSV